MAELSTIARPYAEALFGAAKGADLNAVLADVDALVITLRQRFPNSRLALLGIPPLDVFPALPLPLRQVLGWRAAHYDRAARCYCDSKAGLYYVPIDSRPEPDEFSSDGFHPSVASYAALAREIVRICHDENET